jgi:hypothetical protein
MSDVIDIHGIAHDLAGLEPGELLDVGDGRKVRYLVEPDPFARLDDWDNYGRTEWVKPHRWGTYKHAERPEGFDGSARILNVGGDDLWWQPPTDWPTLKPEVQGDILKAVYRILEVGYQTVIAEVCEGEDAYGRPIVTETYSFCGVEPWEYGDTTTLDIVLCDLLGEVLS